MPARQQAEDVRRYDHGSTSQSRQLASSEVKRALTAPASSLPTKSQFLRPTASRRSASSLMLLWMGRRPSSRNRDRPTRWLRA